MELLQPTQDLSVSVLVSACTYTEGYPAVTEHDLEALPSNELDATESDLLLAGEERQEYLFIEISLDRAGGLRNLGIGTNTIRRFLRRGCFLILGLNESFTT